MENDRTPELGGEPKLRLEDLAHPRGNVPLLEPVEADFPDARLRIRREPGAQGVRIETVEIPRMRPVEDGVLSRGQAGRLPDKRFADEVPRFAAMSRTDGTSASFSAVASDSTSSRSSGISHTSLR